MQHGGSDRSGLSIGVSRTAIATVYCIVTSMLLDINAAQGSNGKNAQLKFAFMPIQYNPTVLLVMPCISRMSEAATSAISAQGTAACSPSWLVP